MDTGVSKSRNVALVSILLLLSLATLTATVAIVFRGPLMEQWHPGTKSLDFGIDWQVYFRSASQAILTGQSPYSIPGVYNPPWAFLPFLPLAFLPEAIGSSALFVLGLAGPAFAAVRTGAKPPETIALMVSPWILTNAMYGNFDWMVMIGATLPPQWGLLLLAIKPQLGAGLALFWIVEAYRRGRLREVVRLLTPVSVAYALSFVFYGFWPLVLLKATGSTAQNTSLGWMGMMIGAVLLMNGLRRHHSTSAFIASPFLSPYMTSHSWGIALFGLIRHRAEFWVAWLVLWAVAFQLI